MFRFLVFVVTLALLFSLTPTTAFAGGGGQDQSFYFSVQGIPGWNTWTGSTIKAAITPPFYANGEGNIQYSAPLHDDNFTTAYWTTESGQKLSTQCLSTAVLGDLQYIAIVKVGVNDTRATQTFDWYVDNYQSDHTWFAVMYSVDTRHRVFTELIEPGGTNNYGSFTTQTSRGGYDLLVAAFIDSPTVPEPSALLALSSGLIGLIGVVKRRR